MALTKVTGQVIKNTTDVTVGVLTVTNTLAVGGTVSIGGTLTYEDVTNIDSVGLITARNGIVVGSGITLSKDGDIFATGVTTSTTFVGALTGAASRITVTDQSSDTTCFPVFAQGATGDQLPHTGTNLTFNSADGTLSATTLSGAVSGTTGTFTGDVDIAAHIKHTGDTDTKISFDTNVIHLDTANEERLRIEPAGNVKAHKNLSVTGIATVGSAVTISESGIEASGIGITCASINDGTIGGRRNLIINGAMNVVQRGNQGAQSYTTAAYGMVDRFKMEAYQTDEADVTISQESTSSSSEPYFAGLRHALKVQVNTAESGSLDTMEGMWLSQRIEAQNLVHLGNGTASALPVTLSFYVRSNLTGTFAVNIQKPDNSARLAVRNYTISSANTWQKVVITFVGDTSGGGIDNNNDAGFIINWTMAAGSGWTSNSGASTGWDNYQNDRFSYGHNVNLLSSDSNNFYITGVQLEIGEEATPFEHRIYQDDLRDCQRYYFKVHPANGAYFGPGFFYSSNSFQCFINFPVLMRSSISTVLTTGTASHYKVIANATTYTCSSAPSHNGDPNNASVVVNFPFSGTGQQGQGGIGRSGSASAFIAVESEL